VRTLTDARNLAQRIFHTFTNTGFEVLLGAFENFSCPDFDNRQQLFLKIRFFPEETRNRSQKMSLETYTPKIAVRKQITLETNMLKIFGM